jgi:hypothetical protein
MSPITGYYSLIQYCPDAARDEAANVGVVLFCPEVGYLEARTASGNDRIRRFFQPADPDWEQINLLKRSIERRLRIDRDQFRDLESLQRFAATRANTMRLTKPKAIAVEDPKAELARLFKQLVGGRRRRKQAKVQAQLDQLLATAEFAPVVRRELTVTLPLFRQPVKVPYGFQNGRFNLIQPTSFVGLSDLSIRRLAGQHAVEGELFHRHRDVNLGDLNLIVVGQFSSDQEDVVSAVREVLHTNQTDLYTTQEIPRLLDLIRTTGIPVAGHP